MRQLIDKLAKNHSLSTEEWEKLISSDCDANYLFQKADKIRKEIYGNQVYIRGLIEISNYCNNNCFYCGIRCENKNVNRYLLTRQEILKCCESGYRLGYRTFVLQSGENCSYRVEEMADIIRDIKKKYPDCAITLSLGEKDYEIYKIWFEAGADRYLLRHETACKEHYQKLHSAQMSFENRLKCLKYLRNIGYQVGCGFMVESPYQTDGCLAKDMEFITKFQPEMIGIGPFIPHKDTPFKDYKQGTLFKTLKMIALTRLACPNALIPATTALGTIDANGRELGLRAGANVVMPNLSPEYVRRDYELYDNKLCSGEEAAEEIEILKKRVEGAGYKIKIGRGDFKAT